MRLIPQNYLVSFICQAETILRCHYIFGPYSFLKQKLFPRFEISWRYLRGEADYLHVSYAEYSDCARPISGAKFVYAVTMLSDMSHQFCYLLSTRARCVDEFYQNLLVKRTNIGRRGKFLPSLTKQYISSSLFSAPAEICKDMQLESDLQPVTGENLPGTNIMNGVRADVSALGLCVQFTRAIIDIMILNPKAPSNWSKEILQMYAC